LRRRAAQRDGLLGAAGRRRSRRRARGRGSPRARAPAGDPGLLRDPRGLAPRAYYESWLDGEKQVSSEQEEPFYQDVYLPRKFKAAVGLSTDNCVDIWSQDVGLLAIVRDGRITGFNLLVGGGLGMTHNKGDTTARLAETLGFVPTQPGIESGRIVGALLRDHGNGRARRYARLKYLRVDWGTPHFREEFQRRASFTLAPP